MNSFELTYQSYGPNAILLSWPQKIENDILKDIVFVKELLLKYEKKQLQDIINGYCTLLLIYNEAFNFILKEDYLRKLITSSREQLNNNRDSKKWTIPVCYHDSFALDLASFSIEKNITKQEVINLHTYPSYKVFCKGFLPGFMYLGGLNSKLHAPRKSEPRLKVPKNSVAIGGKQTGIYPCESPGGWHIIGRTPISLFDIKNEPLSLIKIGDTLSFHEINLSNYLALEAENITLHDYEG